MKLYDDEGIEIVDMDFADLADIVILDNVEDYKLFMKMIDGRFSKYECTFDDIKGPGRYKYIDEVTKLLKERSYKEACDVLRLANGNVNFIIEGDKYYCY